MSEKSNNRTSSPLRRTPPIAFPNREEVRKSLGVDRRRRRSTPPKNCAATKTKIEEKEKFNSASTQLVLSDNKKNVGFLFHANALSMLSLPNKARFLNATLSQYGNWSFYHLEAFTVFNRFHIVAILHLTCSTTFHIDHLAPYCAPCFFNWELFLFVLAFQKAYNFTNCASIFHSTFSCGVSSSFFSVCWFFCFCSSSFSYLRGFDRYLFIYRYLPNLLLSKIIGIYISPGNSCLL